jgi:hypothetical protein
MDEQDGRRAPEIGYMGKIAHSVIADMTAESRRDHVGCDAGDDQSISVGLGCGTRGSADDPTAACAVLDVELLAEHGREVLGNDAAEDVRCSAGRERSDDLHGLIRPVLRPGDPEAENKDKSRNYCANEPHGF